jgi:hypothetical protein
MGLSDAQGERAVAAAAAKYGTSSGCRSQIRAALARQFAVQVAGFRQCRVSCEAANRFAEYPNAMKTLDPDAGFANRASAQRRVDDARHVLSALRQEGNR